MILDEELYLEHYGVKGMRWGVRNNSHISKIQTSKEKVKKTRRFSNKQIAIGASILVGVAASAVLLANGGNIKASVLKRGFEESTLKSWVNGKTTADNLLDLHGDSKELTFPKGEVFSRVSSIAETQIRQGAYATNHPKDVASYKAFWGKNKPYDIKITALTDIKTPSLKTRFETMAEVIDAKDKTGKTIRKQLIDQQSTWRGKMYVRSESAEKLGKIQYSRIIGQDWSKDQGKIFADRLISKGYGAMQDDNDASNNIAQSPLVLLNKGLFKITSNNKMSRADIDSAYADFKKLMKSGDNWPIVE